MRSPLSRVIPGFLLLSLATARPAAGLDYVVPSGAYPDLQSAVTSAATSAVPDNVILIAAPSITVSAKIEFPDKFNPGHRLIIRPDPTLARAQILSDDVSGALIFDFLKNSGGITFQDLDVVRVVTNEGTLIHTNQTELLTFERCRIGSCGAPDRAGLSYMDIVYPGDGGVTIRNCIFFSTYKTAFDFGIQVLTGDSSNELFLYNSCIADYNVKGLVVNDGNPFSLILARNNLFVNNTTSNPEPIAVQTLIGPDVIVVTSHNLAFASPANVQMGFPAFQDLFGITASEAPVYLAPTVPVETSAFSTMAWNPAPGDFNFPFYRTQVPGPLHVATAYGVVVGLMTPDVHDKAVLDDFDRSIRPGGSPLHVDRGPFQVDPSTSGVGGLAGTGPMLRVSPVGNPSQALRLAFASRLAGDLRIDVFDVGGRRVASAQRIVGVGTDGEFTWPAVRRAGVYLYRARLDGTTPVTGRMSLLP